MDSPRNARRFYELRLQTKVAEHSFTTGSFQLAEIPGSSFTEFVSIATNARQAFYITLQSGQYMLYNGGQGSTSAVNVENADMRIYEGHMRKAFSLAARLVLVCGTLNTQDCLSFASSFAHGAFLFHSQGTAR